MTSLTPKPNRAPPTTRIPTSVTIRDGTVAKINDYVYLDSISQGDFYQIVRIMKFLPSTKRDTKVEVAHFYRKFNTGVEWSAKDDPNLLYATLSTEDIHACHIVAKCTVTHVSFINDMDKYRKLENHFYFGHFYEKFQGQIYDVVPTVHINNLPQNVLLQLRERFSFIFAERSEARKLKEPRKDCTVCKLWCENNNAIKCMICEEYYHKQCTNPPILTRFTKGFEFQCSGCLIKAKVDFDDPKQIYVSNLRSGARSSLLPTVKRGGESSDGGDESNIYTVIDLKCTENHPIRYLGKNVSVEKALDMYASPHIRFVVPIGRDHQINVPPYVGPCSAQYKNTQLAINIVKDIKPVCTIQLGKAYCSSRLICTELEAEDDKRALRDLVAQSSSEVPSDEMCPKTQADPKTLYRPQSRKYEMEASLFWDNLMTQKFKIPSHSLQFGTKAYEMMTQYSLDKVKIETELAKLNPLDFGYYSNLADDEAFEKVLLKCGIDFDLVADEFPPMDRGGAVQKFYEWKCEVVKQRERQGPKFPEKPNKLMAMVYPDELNYQEDIISDEGLPELLANVLTSSTTSLRRHQRRQANQVIKSCSHCNAKDEVKWLQVPTFVTQKTELLSIFCFQCANYLFRHGVPRPLNEPVQVLASTNRKNPSRSLPKQQSTTMEDLNDKSRDPNTNRASGSERSGKSRNSSSSHRTRVIASSPSPSSQASDSQQGSIVSSPTTSSPSSVIVRRKYKSRKRQLEDLDDDELNKPRRRPNQELSFANNNKPKPKIKLKPPTLRCMCCNGQSNLVRCAGCGLEVHPGCYPGLNTLQTEEDWLCNFCHNVEEKVYSYEPCCIACRKIEPHDQPKCLIPTLGNNWVHIMCLAFIDPLWVNSDGLVAGVFESNCSPWDRDCDLCTDSFGLTVMCSLCDTRAHVLCAQASDYWLGLEYHPISNSYSPRVTCSDHNRDDMIGLVSLDAIDPESGLTLLGKFLSTKINNQPINSTLASTSDKSPLTALCPLAKSMTSLYRSWDTWTNNDLGKIITCIECHATTSFFWWNVYSDDDFNYKSSGSKSQSGAIVRYKNSRLEPNFDDPGHHVHLCHGCYWRVKEV